MNENMKNQCLLALLLLFSVATLGQTKEQVIPQTVEFPSGTLHLKAYLWKPAGPGLAIYKDPTRGAIGKGSHASSW